ncbi:MAG TPA: hypothetical protein VFV34_12720 [Blastocatellia bacterium]|nr:hypothetical protein [Blastocatellia bacterium]
MSYKSKKSDLCNASSVETALESLENSRVCSWRTGFRVKPSMAVLRLVTIFLLLGLGSAVCGQRLIPPGPERNTLAAVPNGLGPKKVAVLLFNYADNPADQPVTTTGARQLIFTNTDSTNSFVKAASFNQMSLIGHLRSDGDVFGWLTLPLTGSPNDKYTPARVPDIERLAQPFGFNRVNYDVILYVHPPSVGDPGWAGQAFGAGPGGKEVELWGINPAVAAHETFHIL